MISFGPTNVMTNIDPQKDRIQSQKKKRARKANKASRIQRRKNR